MHRLRGSRWTSISFFSVPTKASAYREALVFLATQRENPPSPPAQNASSSPPSIPPAGETTPFAPASSRSLSPTTTIPSHAALLDSLSSPNPNPTLLCNLFAQIGLPGVSPTASAVAILQILLTSGVSLASVKSLSRRGWHERIFSLPVDDVSAKVDLLGPAVLSASPSLFECSMESIRSKVEFFENLGLRVQKMSSFGRVFKLKLDSIEERVAYLRNLGLNPDRLALALGRYPFVLCVSLERIIKPAVEFLEKDCKLPRETICRYFTSRPSLLTLSRSNLVQKVRFLESIGIDPRCPQFYSSVVGLCNLSPSRLTVRINWLMSTGFSPEAVRKLILCAPFVLCCTEANVEKKLHYLLVESNRDTEEIRRYPTVLTFSLERRIKPRFAVIALLQKNGFLNESPSLPVILSSSDEQFKQRFIVKYQDKGDLEELASL